MEISRSTAREKSKCCCDVRPSETEWLPSLAKTSRLPEALFGPSLFILLLSCLELGDTDVNWCREEESPLQGKVVILF